MRERELGAAERGQFGGALLGWFDEHKRDLPWRRTRDPYAIWVSEIMLQQTRVAAVLGHYARWMERFPTVNALAAAEEPEVLAMWSGLGYYRRARYLHAGARVVVAEHAGVLPRTAAGLAQLPGVGEYTSAAIASIAFGEPVAVVDGNVERVILRLTGLAAAAASPGTPAEAAIEAAGDSNKQGASALPRQIRTMTNALLVTRSPGQFNQAMMELGATVCLPRGPLCLQCPVQRWCVTRGEHIGTPRKAMRSCSIAYALAERRNGSGHELLLRQRARDASLMAGMWELPEVPLPAQTSAQPLLTLRHAITVTNYRVSILRCEEAAELCTAGTERWTAVADLPELALTGLARKALRRLGLWPAEL